MDLVTLITIVGLIIGLVVVLFGDNLIQQATGLSIFELLRKGLSSLSRVFRRQPSPNPEAAVQLDTSNVIDYVKGLGTLEVFPIPFTRNLIAAKLYQQATLKTDPQIDAAFENMNQQRRSLGKFEYYSYPRYRIIRKPIVDETKSPRKFMLELAEIDFEYFVLQHDETVDLKTKDYIRAKVDAVAESLPSHLQSTDPFLNSKNVGMLGVQIVIITSDGYTLLRRRGKHVMEYRDTWDISFSGYCGKGLFDGGQFDIGNTVEYELDQEIIKLRGDPREINFTGLHLSTINKTTVMLGYWKVKANRHELRAFIDGKSLEKTKNQSLVFDTTTLPKEKYVWDYKNMIVEFNAQMIANALQVAENSLTGQLYKLVPASHASLLLALNASGKSTEGLIK